MAQKYDYFLEYRDTIYEVMRDSLIEADILFDTDEYGLLAPEVRKLDYVIAQARQNFSYSIDLIGYADYRGSDEYNYELAHRRVVTTRDYFLLRRLQDSLMSTQVIGEVPPINEVVDPDRDLQPDRHVTVRATVYYKEAIKDSIPELRRLMTCPENDTLITFANGVEVFVIGCSFPGYLIRDLKFECLAADSRGEMLSNRLTTTTTEGECLQTSGMVFFNVMNKNDKKVSTVPKRPMTVRVPTASFEEGIELFDAANPNSSSPRWMPSEDTLMTESFGCRKFYSVRTTSSMVKNLDKPTGVFSSNGNSITNASSSQAPSDYFRLRGFSKKHSKAYLSGKRSNLRGKFFQNHRFEFKQAPCIPHGEEIVTVFVKKKKKRYVYHQPLWMVARQKKSWFLGKSEPCYIIRKRDFYKAPEKMNVYQQFALLD